MLTLLASTFLPGIGGFLINFVPKALEFFETKRDQAHELAIMEKQLEHDKVRHEQRIEAMNIDADIRETEALYKQAASETGGGWFIEGLRASVRPVIAYTFMGLFVIVKISALFVALEDQDWKNAVQLVWDNQSMAIFSTIIGFYFGGRNLKHFTGKG